MVVTEICVQRRAVRCAIDAAMWNNLSPSVLQATLDRLPMTKSPKAERDGDDT
jgi:hypothetical protein